MKFDADKAYHLLQAHFKERVCRDEPLARHCSFGAGGPADLWVNLASTQELIHLVSLCAEEHFPLFVMGNGTTILFADRGMRGIVARMATQAYQIEVQGPDHALLIADAGVNWSLLIQQLAALGWGGLDFGIGIPGTLAGGVVSNARAHYEEIGQRVQWLDVLDARGCNIEGEDQFSSPLQRRYEHNDLDLGYRYSRFRKQRQAHFDNDGRLLSPSRSLIEPAEIILRLALLLEREDPQRLRARVKGYQARRKQIEPMPYHAGPIFKDASDVEIRHLLEQAGVQGLVQGQAMVSTRHPNYIMNLGGACASDATALLVQMHQQVQERLGVDLSLDLELHGEWEEDVDQKALADQIYMEKPMSL